MGHCGYRREVLRRTVQEGAPNEVVRILPPLKVSVFGNAICASDFRCPGPRCRGVSGVLRTGGRIETGLSRGMDGLKVSLFGSLAPGGDDAPARR